MELPTQLPSPEPSEVIAARLRVQVALNLGSTEAQTWCAALVHCKVRAWQQWENADRAMQPGLWELFQLKLPQHLGEPDTPVKWPTSKDTSRLEDMSPNGHLRVMLDNDGDVCVEVFNGEVFAGVEFCTSGNGGGKSPRVRQALIGVMLAIEADNKADVFGSRRHPRYNV